MTILCVNLVNFRTVTPEFNIAKGVQPLVFQTSYLRIHWNDFHRSVTVW